MSASLQPKRYVHRIGREALQNMLRVNVAISQCSYYIQHTRIE